MINKVVLGVVGLASTSAVGCGVYYLGIFSKEKISISSLVEKDDYTVIMSNNDSLWDSKLVAYKTSSNTFELKEVSLDNLKSKCSNLAKTGKVSSEKDKTYSDFLKFCTRDKTTKEKLSSLEKSILPKDGKNDIWTTRFGQYKLDSNKDKFTHFTVGQGDADSTSFSKLSKGCNDLSEKAWREVRKRVFYSGEVMSWRA